MKEGKERRSDRKRRGPRARRRNAGVPHLIGIAYMLSPSCHDSGRAVLARMRTRAPLRECRGSPWIWGSIPRPLSIMVPYRARLLLVCTLTRSQHVSKCAGLSKWPPAQLFCGAMPLTAIQATG